MKLSKSGIFMIFSLVFIFCADVFAEESVLDDELAVAGEAVSEESNDANDDDGLAAAEAAGAEIAAIEANIPDDEEDFSYLFEAADPFVFEVAPFLENRSFDDIFPGMPQDHKSIVMHTSGLRYSFEKDGSPTLIPCPDSGIELFSSVMEKKPSHVIEALVIVPYNENELDMLDIYNALGRIKNLKDHTIPLKNGSKMNIFTDTTRIENAKSKKPISDPLPASALPYSETMYLRFTDAYIGDLFIRGDIIINPYGITYSITNFTDVRYSIFKIMKAERFSSYIYLEPVKEGILVYSMSGIYLPGFIASRINLTPNINARINALLNWIIEGLRIQETSSYRLEKGMRM